MRARLLALALLATVTVRADPPAPRPAVLVVTHAYDGPEEATGRVAAWRYVGDAMQLDLVPDGDGIFRNGFQGRAQ